MTQPIDYFNRFQHFFPRFALNPIHVLRCVFMSTPEQCVYRILGNKICFFLGWQILENILIHCGEKAGRGYFLPNNDQQLHSRCVDGPKTIPDISCHRQMNLCPLHVAIAAGQLRQIFRDTPLFSVLLGVAVVVACRNRGNC